MNQLTLHEDSRDVYHCKMINLTAGMLLILIAVIFIKNFSYADVAFLCITGVLSVLNVLVKSNITRNTINFILGISFLAVFCILFGLLIFSSMWPFAMFTGLKTKYLLLYLTFSALFFYTSSKLVK